MSFKQRFLEEIQKPYSVTGIDIKKANYFLYAMLALFIFLHILIYYVLIDPQVYSASGGIEGYPKWLEAIVNWHSSFNPVLEEQAKASGSMRLYHGAIYTVWVAFAIPMVVYGLLFANLPLLINHIKYKVQGRSIFYHAYFVFIILFGFHFVFWYAFYHLFLMGVPSVGDDGVLERFFIYRVKEHLLLFGSAGLFFFFIMVGSLIHAYARFLLVFFDALLNFKLKGRS